MAPRVSIVIVDCRTPMQTRLCMRSLRKYTRLPVETIVVENAPADASAEYLRGLSWIRYVENDHPEPNHRNGLDLGIRLAKSEWVLTMHTDTFVRSECWLDRLLERIRDDTMIVGSQDRLIRPLHPLLAFDDRRRRRKLESRWRAKGQAPKIISHCTLYRRELFALHGQRFDHPEWIDGVYNDCGEFIQRYCEEKGFGIVLLDRAELAPLIWHFEAATLNLVTGRRIPWKRRLRTWRFYRRPEVQAILADDSLDA